MIDINELTEVTLPEPDNFLKVKETLSRIGIASKKDKTLYQSCHILHKQGRYFIVHFKQMFLLDGKKSDFSLEDGFITGSCFTAWSPPLGVMMELSKKYPVRVVIEYDEAGMPFQGEIEYEDGVETVIYDRSGEDYVSNYEEEDD